MRYIALLRAINVGGHSIIKMDELRTAVQSCGMDDVSTYIQTGNVLFKTNDAREKVHQKLERALNSATGREIKVFVLTPADLKQAADNNPFNPDRNDPNYRSHIIFLDRAPGDQQIKAVMELERDDYKFKAAGKVFYYAYHKKYEGHTRRTVNFEKILGVSGTARNWKVVNKLIELSHES